MTNGRVDIKLYVQADRMRNDQIGAAAETIGRRTKGIAPRLGVTGVSCGQEIHGEVRDRPHEENHRQHSHDRNPHESIVSGRDFDSYNKLGKKHRYVL